MACAELAPIVKVGPLADAVAALARTLSRLEHKVAVVLPRYAAIDESGLMLARRLTPIRFEVGGETMAAALFDARLGSGVELMLIDLPGVFEGDAIYGEHEARDFGLFSRAVAELVRSRAKAGTPFDVVHAHDWSTALVPHLLRRQSDELDLRTVLTVHDGASHGRFDKAVMDQVGLSWDDFHPSALEFYGDVSFLKGGLLSADAITTVSPTYADELQRETGEGGFDGVYRSRAADFIGVLEGIDYGRWSPSTDSHIAARYDAEDTANKGRCKAALLNELDLPLEPERPLIVTLGPISHEAGSDLVAALLPDLVRTGARVVVAGPGDNELAATIDDVCAGMEEDAVFVADPSDPMTHRLVAAADALLLPHRVAPGAMWHQIGQRYGSAPIALAVSGVRDVVVDCDAHGETGTGFLAGEADPTSLKGAVGRAVGAMKSPWWGALRRRLMRLDRSWESPARRYARLYKG